MPELPEVEVVRLGIDGAVCGRVLDKVVVRERRLRWPIPESLPACLTNRRLLRVERRAKYLLLGFENGVLIVHLGMSGNFRVLPVGTPVKKHDHVDLQFDGGVLRYHDPRRFGAMLWHPKSAGPVLRHKLLCDLGLEPLSAGFNAQTLHRASRHRRVSVKQFLMAGKVVVGVGNIYVSESLFRAKIRPTRSAGRLSKADCKRLASAIVATLREAISQGGTTLRDFAGASGDGGYFQLDCHVYGREGLPCRLCGTVIKRSVMQQRATYWCRDCQS